MSAHRRPARRVMSVVALAVVTVSCGNSSEEGLEQLIERQSGEDVEIDLGGGGFNIETDEGSVRVDEDGNFVVVGPDGEVISGDVQVGSDGINVQTDDGGIVIQGDGESGSIDITGEDGDISFSSSQSIPDEWPADVPRPTGLTIIAGSTFGDGTTSTVTVTGSTSASPGDYVESYGPMLEAAGLERSSFFESGGSVTGIYENATWIVSVSGFSDGGDSNISISVSPATP